MSCWRWIGAQDGCGYGRAIVGGTLHRTHRLMFELLSGPIPEGLVLDHLCRVRNCCNPEHLEPVTNNENVRRGLVSESNKRRANGTLCRKGLHFWGGDNIVTLSNGIRLCRECRRLKWNKWKARNALVS